MSRIILSKYPDRSEHVVVGWDHPAGGCFWQEWASQGEIELAEKWVDSHPEDDSAESRLMMEIAETGVKRGGGMWPGIAIDDLRRSMPQELQPLVTTAVLLLLRDHSRDPESGRLRLFDMSHHDKTVS